MTTQRSILIVEDDAVMRAALAKHLAVAHRVLAVSSWSEARASFARRPVDLVVLDLHLPDGDGLELVSAFRQDDQAEVVVVTAYPKVQSAVRALKAGAFDYINKPFDLEEFDIVVQKALEHRGLRDEVQALRRQRAEAGGVERILGDAPSVARLRGEILQVAETPDTTVLLRGESGTGKELVVDAIHHEGARRSGPLVRVNCPSIPATMIEAELFGHERGAFTDAKAARRGLLEMANNGTLFLDEIGDLPLDVQPKLLRVLETRCFRRLGGSREIEVDVRFVTATNRDLEAMATARGFREDLLFRLKVFEIRVPPLRERRSDVPLLARHFLKEFARRFNKPVSDLTPEVLRSLEIYGWPGNIRELRNVIERAVILSQSQVIASVDLPSDLKATPLAPCGDFCPAFPEGLASFPDLAELEKRYLLCVYRMAGRNKTRAAKILGMSRLTLRAKLKQYGIEEEGG